ncbi:MAG: hypothetical protein AAGK05_18455 [Pseudomonadota bacterium]
MMHDAGVTQAEREENASGAERRRKGRKKAKWRRRKEEEGEKDTQGPDGFSPNPSEVSHSASVGKHEKKNRGVLFPRATAPSSF